MHCAGLLFLLAGVIETTPSPVFADVHIGSHGPYRFLVDTGSQSSVIDPALAAELGLRAEFRVELVTQHTTRLVPGMKASNLRVGSRAIPEAELLFHDVAEPRRLDPTVRGVLGMSALSSFDFLLSPVSGRLEAEAQRPAGVVVPLYRVEGRLALKVRMGKETLTLILDSGSSHVVLFRTPAAMAKTPAVEATISTLEGARSAAPTRWTAEMQFASGLRIGMLPAAIVDRGGYPAEGLLPASVFKQIYIDQARGELVLVR